MRKEAEEHAEDDRHRKELVEARNNADNAAYTAEKTLRDLGDKVPADMKKKVEDQVTKVRQVMSSDDTAKIKSTTDELFQTIQQIGAAAYQQSGPAAGGTSGPSDSSGPSGPQQPGPNGEDVVDGEFRNV
jgi:molecular chaperone DnaK